MKSNTAVWLLAGVILLAMHGYAQESCASTVDLYADDLDYIDEDGIMFDVFVPGPAEYDGKLVDGIFVQDFTFQLSRNVSNEPFELQMIIGDNTYVGNERDESRWVTLTSQTITGSKDAYVTVGLNLDIFVPRSSSRGFLLTFTNEEAMKYHNTAAVGYDDPNGVIGFSDGAAKGYGNGGGLWRGRDFKGSVCYTVLTVQDEDEADIVWSSGHLGPSLESTPAIGSDGKIYAVGQPNVYAFSPSEGVISNPWNWRTNIGTEDFVSPSVSADGQTVYCAAKGVYALNTANGTIRWRSENGVIEFLRLYSTPALSPDGETLYIGAGAERDESDLFFAIDAANGEVKWTYELDKDDDDIFGFRGFLGGAITRDVGGETIVYVASQHGWMISLKDNGNSFEVEWETPIGAEMRMPPAYADGYLFVGDSESGDIHKVRASDGEEVMDNAWPVHVNSEDDNVGEVFANIAISSSRTLYANSEDRYLYAIDMVSGAIKWRSPQFAVWGSDPLIRRDGRIIVMAQLDNTPARVIAIRDDDTSGVIEWTSAAITATLNENETNVAIGADGTIYVLSGDRGISSDGNNLRLWAIRGKAGVGLSTSAPWPKYMGNMANSGQ